MVRLLLIVSFATVLSAVVLSQPQEVRLLLVSATDHAGDAILGLQADDFKVENGGAACEIVDVVPASYPLALIVDTSTNAASDLPTLRAASTKFVEALAPRQVALYTSGTPVSRVEDFTPVTSRIVDSLTRLFAGPDSTTHSLATLLHAVQDVRRSMPIVAVIVLSAGAVEMNPPDIHQLAAALLKGHTIVHFVERQAVRVGTRGVPQGGNADVFAAISQRTNGQYLHGASSSVYGAGLDSIRRQLDAESIVSYVTPPTAAHAARVRVRTPATSVRAIPLDTIQ